MLNTEKLANSMRVDALTMAFAAGASAAHFGGGVSHIDILAVLYGAIMKVDSKNPTWDIRDRFILSKGHGVLGYYAALYEKGFFSKEELCSFEKSGSALLGHPVQNIEKGIEFTTGSLGQGLAIGLGVALSLKEEKKDSKVFVLMGDGECNEGSVWESFMAASQFKTDNLFAIIDRNRLQLGGLTEDVMDVGNIAEKIHAFGWDVREVDGHNIQELYQAFTQESTEGKPVAIVANTIKGYGFSFAENNNAYHHAIITRELYELGMQELGLQPEADKILSLVEKWKEEHPYSMETKELSDNESNQILVELQLTKQIIRRYNMVGQRAAFGLAAIELVKQISNLKVITADVSTSAGLDRFRKTYIGNYLDVGIAEQNMMGIATGFSNMGYNVITTTFAPFQSMRCLEQIRVNLGYMNTKVIMVGLASGLVLGTLGNTHCCFEDMGVLRTIPNIAIVSPADAGEAAKALAAAINYPQSVYIRLMDGGNCPIVYDEDYVFEIGKSITLKEISADEKDVVTIYAIGTMVKKALQVAECLEEKNVSVRVINMHTIKPIDILAIEKACEDSQLIVTVEEHNIYGGLGTAVAEVLATKKGAPLQLMIGLEDRYLHGATYQEMLEATGLTVDNISNKILESL